MLRGPCLSTTSWRPQSACGSAPKAARSAAEEESAASSGQTKAPARRVWPMRPTASLSRLEAMKCPATRLTLWSSAYGTSRPLFASFLRMRRRRPAPILLETMSLSCVNEIYEATCPLLRHWRTHRRRRHLPWAGGQCRQQIVAESSCHQRSRPSKTRHWCSYSRAPHYWTERMRPCLRHRRRCPFQLRLASFNTELVSPRCSRRRKTLTPY